MLHKVFFQRLALGVDTTVVNLGVAAIFFALAASFTLLVGLGGRSVAAEVAATRTLRRLLSVGDRIQTDAVAGLIVAMNPTTFEVETDSGDRVLVPSTSLSRGNLIIDRSGRSNDAVE